MEQTILFVNDKQSVEKGETASLRPFSLFNSDLKARVPLTIVASLGENNELGRGGDLCWHIADDLRHFKALTLGGTVIMGRKTWESLPRRPLPGRLNIVVSSNPAYAPEGALTASSLAEAVEIALASLNPDNKKIFIIGGESVYRTSLPYASRLELTRIFDSDPEADKFFPEFPEEEWRETFRSETMVSPQGTKYAYLTYERR